MILTFYINRKSSLRKGTFFVFALLLKVLFCNGQQALVSGPGKWITPLHGGYILFTAGVKAFNYSSVAAHVDLTLPYSVEDSTGNKIDGTFQGHCTIPNESRHVEARTLAGLEFHPRRGPSYDCKFSISSDKEPYGKFESNDYFQFGMHYNLGIIPGGRFVNALSLGIPVQKPNPFLVLIPGIALIRRDKDYYCGTIDSLTGKDLFVNGRKVNIADIKKTPFDSAGFTYATFNHLVRLEVGIWWLTAQPLREGRTRNFILRRFSFRTEFAYDLLLWQTEDVYVVNAKSRNALMRFGNHYTRNWAVTSVNKPVHHYDGLSVSFTLFVTFSSW
jgi:hypothetical protein